MRRCGPDGYVASREIVHYVADSELQMYQVLSLLAFLVQKYKF